MPTDIKLKNSPITGGRNLLRNAEGICATALPQTKSDRGGWGPTSISEHCKMILRTQNIIRITRVAAISWMLLLGACSDSADEAEWMRPDTPGTGGVDDETSSCTLGLYIRMGDSAGKQDSRAATPPDNGHYLSGTGYENYIYIGGETPDLRVYLFNLDDKLIAEIAEPNLNAMAAPGSGVVTYSITFRVDELIPDCYEQPSFKVVMLANWREYPSTASLVAGVTTIADLVESAEGIADYSPAPAVLGLNDRLPFFGVAQYNNVRFLPDETTFADESLWLLRAYAKIEVWDNAETVTPISAVRLVGHNTRAYKAPLGVTHQDQYVKFDYDNDADFVTTPSLPAANPSVWETSEPMTFEKRAADGHFVTYVPEYRNIGTDGTERADRCYLQVTYKDGNTFDVPFRYGAGAPSGTTPGSPYNLLRNYWYKFICKRNVSEMTWSVDVMPYGEVLLEPDFGIKP